MTQQDFLRRLTLVLLLAIGIAALATRELLDYECVEYRARLYADLPPFTEPSPSSLSGYGSGVECPGDSGWVLTRLLGDRGGPNHEE